MSDPLLERPLVPVAGPDDAAATCRALFPRLSGDECPTFLHVIEQGTTAMDASTPDDRDLAAERMLDDVADRADRAGVDVDTEVRYATEVAGAVVDTAGDLDATAIVFVPRGGGGGLWSLLRGGVRTDLVTESDRPVVVLPEAEGD